MTGKTIVIGVAVFGAGFVTGWAARALVKKKNDELSSNPEKYEPKNNDSVIRISMDADEYAHYKHLVNKYDTMFTKEEKEAIETANAESESPSEEDDDDEIVPLYGDPYDNYIDYEPTNPYGEDPEDYEEEGNTKVKKKNVWPYEIDVNDFDSENGYTKSSLEYYKNNVLIDEDGTEISNAGSLIGNGVLKDLISSKSVAYVRNENLEIDYEISYINEDYESYEDWED